MSESLLPLSEVCARLGSCHRATVYRMVQEGELPPPVKIGARSAWPESEVDATVERLKGRSTEPDDGPIPSMCSHPRAAEPTCLYRHRDKGGVLLYVGIALSPAARLKSHRDGSHWFRRIARIDVEWFDDRLSAMQAEARAIRNERPLYNVVHAQGAA